MCKTKRRSTSTFSGPWIICWLVLLKFADAQFGGGRAYNVPQSPCPQTFQYRSNGFEVIGVGQILPGQYVIGETIQMMAYMIISTSLPSNYYGKIEFLGTPEQVVNQMYSNEPITFQIMFPIQDPLPIISSITANGQAICSGNDFNPNQGVFTRVTLQYMFKPIVTGNFRPRPSSSFGGRPNNIFTVVTEKNPNNGGFQSFTQSQRPTQRQPTTESVIGLIGQQNNFDFNIPRQEAPTRAPVVQPVQTTAATRTEQNFDIGCGKIPNEFTPLVFGGTSIAKGDWPFIAALHHYQDNSYKFKCGATVISATTIISAAHCFFHGQHRIKAQDALAFIGHFNLKKLQEEGSQIINLASVIVHPEYRSKFELYSDIAVGKLSESIVFSTYIQPACLWSGSADQSLIVGRRGVIVGWGIDESGVQQNEPKRVEVPIVSDQNCLRSHQGFSKITSERTFCAGWRNGSEGPCAGDSGSGLMLNQNGAWYLRGLVSLSLKDANTGQCDLNEFVVFTDVAKFVPWITSLL